MTEPREPTGRTLLEPSLAISLSEPSTRPFAAWLVGRTLAGLFAVALVAWAESARGKGELGLSSIVLVLLGITLVCGSALVGFMARRGVSRRALGTPLMLTDLMAIAVLVYLTGGASSVFAGSYGVVVVLAALLLGPEAALATTAAALVLHLFVVLGLSAGILPAPPDAPRGMYVISPLQLSIALSGHATALLVVGLLSRALAVRVRRAGGDVERAQASAERLERLNASIIEGIGSGLATLDPRGRISSANPAARRILGDAGDMLVGGDALALLPLDGIALPPSRAERRDGVGHRLDGSEFPCGLTASRLRGDRDRTLVVFQDLSELRKLQKKAEQAERLASLGRIAASLAHEIRNPLGAISGSVQLVRDATSLDEDERKLLDIVSREVERLDTLVRTMLAASRPREPVRRWVELRAIAADVVALVGRSPRASSGARVTLRGGPEVRGHLDEQQLRQVLWNLLENALAAAPDGVRVEISVERLREGARICVDDAGPGIPPEKRARLFEPFYSGQPLGVGLGLSIVDQIVRAHGGTIEATESPLGGARFEIEIPDEVSAERRPDEPA